MNKHKLPKLTYLSVCCLMLSLHTAASVNIAETSQIVTINAKPNILLIVDNSSSMKEDVSGQVATACTTSNCPIGAANPSSKASIIKNVASSIVNDFTGQVNLGLMAYQQYPLGTTFNSLFDKKVASVQVGNRLYDVTYQVGGTSEFTYDPNSTDMNWQSNTKRYRIPHPSVSGQFIYYNIGIPGYQNDLNNHYCTTTTPNEPLHFNFRCWRSKSDNDNRLPSSNTNAFGYSNFSGQSTFTLGDSPRARGVTHYGSRMILRNLNYKTWHAIDSPGLGFLHIPIQDLNSAHANKVLKKLAPQEDVFSTNLLTDPNKGLVAAGLTPLEGTLYTATDYLTGQTDFFKNAQGRSNLPVGYQLPQSCGNDVAIWLTDGMPSVSRQGVRLGNDPTAALNDAIASATRFNDLTKAKLYIVGFAMPPTVNQATLDLLAIAGKTSNAYLADNPEKLKESLVDIFNNAIKDSLSSSGVTSSSSELSTNTATFQTELNTLNWGGELISLSMASGVRDRGNPNWRAAQLLNQRLAAPGAIDNRIIIGAFQGQGYSFTLNAMPDSLKSHLKTSTEANALIEQRINFMRGSSSHELKNGGSFRDRESKLGHIVNSTPLYVAGEGSRPPMIYIMANDGMLHGFNANTGQELFAFIPEIVINKIRNYTAPNYAGQFMLDGQMVAADVNGKKVLIGTAGLAGKSVFALDISDPANFNTNHVLWEVNGNSAFNNHLGITTSGLQVVQYNNKTAVAFGNGYNSSSGKSALLLVDAEKGTLLHSFVQDGLGFGSPGMLDLNRDGKADFVYVGDFNGKLWRFRLNPALNSWPEAQHFFTTNGNRPITSAPVIGSHPNGGVMVVFGSGELITSTARTSNATEYVYGIRDKFTTGVTQPPTNVVEQTITSISGTNRFTSQNPVTDADLGWRLRLPAGERMMASGSIRHNRVLFGSYKPDDTPCNGGGIGYYTQLNLFSGTPLKVNQPSSEQLATSSVPRVPVILRAPSTPYIPNCPEENCKPIPADRELILIGDEDRMMTSPRGRQQWRELAR